MSNYYIADLHLGHENAMKRFDHRPFRTLDEQDSTILKRLTGTRRISP